ncbi:MAG: helix-turn-helix domain-containing protein, partial [Alphaproteobacteria bacterium]
LSKLSGISIGAISKIEKGQTRAAFDTVLRIGRALRISFVEMMDGPSGRHTSSGRMTFTRLGEAQTFETAEYLYKVHSGGLMHKVMIPLHITIKGSNPPSPDEWTTHDGEKFIFVLSGVVTILTEQYAPITLKERESCYFDSTMRHCMVSAVDGSSEVLSVCLTRESFEEMEQKD